LAFGTAIYCRSESLERLIPQSVCLLCGIKKKFSPVNPLLAFGTAIYCRSESLERLIPQSVCLLCGIKKKVLSG
jgi:hypothetical protein